MSASTFWFIKAGLGWAASLSGVWWADAPDCLAGRIWLLLVALSITATVTAVLLRTRDREVEVLRLGLDLGRTVGTEQKAGRGQVRPIR